MKYSKIFVSAILAGACIGCGGLVYLSLDNKVLGSLFFTVGLFTICIFGLHLFTGKVCYVFQNDKAYLFSIPVIWIGNLIGTGAVAAMARFSRLDFLVEKAVAVSQVKLGDDFLSLFLLAILCNIFIYIGVEGFKSAPHEAGKYLALFFGVMVFILCGFEHCIANMFYFSLAGVWSTHTIACLVVMTAGNALGGIIFPVVRGWLAN